MKTKAIALLFFTSLLASAEVVTVQLTGTSGVSDGADYVLPYQLSINGAASIGADCYDLFDVVFVGESWTANEFTLAQVLVDGQYAGDVDATENYELAGIFSTLATTSPQDQIDLQHDFWNLFDPGSFVPNTGMSAYLATAESQLGTFDFANTRYLEGVSGTSPAVQAFVINKTDTLEFSDSPESGTALLMGIGLVGVVALGRRRSR